MYQYILIHTRCTHNGPVRCSCKVDVSTNACIYSIHAVHIYIYIYRYVRPLLNVNNVLQTSPFVRVVRFSPV